MAEADHKNPTTPASAVTSIKVLDQVLRLSYILLILASPNFYKWCICNTFGLKRLLKKFRCKGRSRYGHTLQPGLAYLHCKPHVMVISISITASIFTKLCFRDRVTVLEKVPFDGHIQITTGPIITKLVCIVHLVLLRI